jgi:ribose transport system permease protein
MRLGPLMVLFVLLATFGALSDVFLTTPNLQNLGVQSSPVIALALGQMFVIVARGVDLSVGSTIALTSVVGALTFQHSHSFLVVLAAMLATGLAVGLANGLIYVKGGLINPFIVTIATLYIVSSLALIISNGQSIIGLPAGIQALGQNYVGPVPVAVIVIAGLIGVASLLATRTKLGRWVYAIGGNPEAAERAGIPVGRIRILVYMISGFGAAVAGIITAARTDSGYPTAGDGLELDAIAAVVIGGTSLYGGRGNVFGVVIGAIMLGAIRNGLDLLNVTPFWQTGVIGSVILVAVALDAARARLEARVRLNRALRVEQAA